MSTIKELLLPSTVYTISAGSGLTGLAANAAWQTAAQDNSSTSTGLWLDALVQVQVRSTGTGIVTVYAYGSADGTTYPDTVTGTEGTLTLVNPTNLVPIGRPITVAAAGTSYRSMPLAVAPAFSGTLPTKWGLVLVNGTTAVFDSTLANFAIVIAGVQAQVV